MQIDIKMVWMVLLQMAASLLLTVDAVAPGGQPPPGCRASCGNISIPYPFGIGPYCSMEGFTLDCTKSKHDGAEKLYFFNLEIIDISLLQGQARMYNQISWQCYNPEVINASQRVNASNWSVSFIGTPYRLSSRLNKFTTIGCEALGYIINKSSGSQRHFESGCVSMCEDEKSLTNGTCSGIGCCQTSIPEDLDFYNVYFDSNFNSSQIWNFSHCSYAVLLEAASFEFRTSYITTNDFWYKPPPIPNGSVPTVVDWAIRGESCSTAELNASSYGCVAEHSECVDSANGPGYLCNCSSGYQGNPYLSDGCKDINECLHKENFSCFGNCINEPGSYSCLCPPGTQGNPRTNATCYPNPEQNLPLGVKLVIGIICGIAFILLSSMFIFLGHEKRKLELVKRKYFHEHGGRLLLEEMQVKQGLPFKIFKKEELDRATNKFDKRNILGQGGHGTVYKGILEDKSPVAIKKSKIIDENQKKEFGKEMIILSQINHKNIVKLLGCCLEVEVPMLVYQFVPNRNLSYLIHEQALKSKVSLDTRLRIACESADALAYLHTSHLPPIIHGDVKPENILLDESYAAKVSDFGASILAANNEIQFVTMIQGTWGYLDPECLRTCQLTDKNDVYSFGVVLAELFTGRKALSFEGQSEEKKSLASAFVLAMKENRILEIVDSQVKAEGQEGLIREIALLVTRCLSILVEERPAMEEVAKELERLRNLQQHPWLQNNIEETESLLSRPSNRNDGASIYFSITEKAAINIDSVR